MKLGKLVVDELGEKIDGLCSRFCIDREVCEGKKLLCYEVLEAILDAGEIVCRRVMP